ncbi:endo-beta-glucanase [Lactarius akahatsu]|uniref:Endo-beta-glucanase n=1 Tax=Lactarius akahatsu TaxID=416441 RepID=A0AAD4LAR0_9AGAM|nr:endo-beta-glucanase [Lactarius akahatsu]
MKTIAPLLLLFLLAPQALARTYSVADTYQGANFFDTFQFFTGADPTHGRSKGLATVSGGNFIIRADHTTQLDPSGPGRNSVRITSNKQYDTHVSIYNVVHMPQGCGTWPAIWENGANWPAGGEIDIVEGVNDQGSNLVSLHTSPGCSMPASRAETGSHTGLDCNTAANGNAGCGARFTDGNSYGPSFNANGGGWYALERTNSFIKVWFWGRGSGSTPAEVANGAGSINTDTWGTPAAYFPNAQCDIGAHFGPASIIINIDLCGDWAGNVYSSSGCPGSCVDLVNNNPGAFSGAFFEFSWVKVYQ